MPQQRLRLVSLFVLITLTSTTTNAFQSLISSRSSHVRSRLSSSPENDEQRPQTLDPSKIPRTLDASSSRSSPPLIETIGGGTSTIFDMARRMLLWQEEENSKQKPLPRWHPHSGISDVNPSFRTQSPIMNNQGYASTIWRNVRKRNKPSLWRHALRTYDRMEQAAVDTKTSVLRIERSTVHHEGALLACAKLGLWKRALEILESIGDPSNLTDNMIYSLVKASVRACKMLNGSETSLHARREPLDAVRNAILEYKEELEFPLMARHWNPLAAAYQSLGLVQEAQALLQAQLEDRSIGPEPERGQESFNVHNIRAKDKSSYALLVKGAIYNKNWKEAVEALETMTEAGLYPAQSHLNSWTEMSERRKSRIAKSWKKKRDEYWLESVR